MKNGTGMRRATAWLIDDGQGCRVSVTSNGGDVHERPVVLATTQAELDQVVRVLRSLRDQLPSGEARS